MTAPADDLRAARGTIFHPDPRTTSGDDTLSWDAPDAALQAQCVDLALPRLDPPVKGLFHLRGRYVHTTTRRPPPDQPPTEPTGDFRFGVREPGFLYVMAYYWLDGLVSWVHGLGVEALEPALARPVEVDPMGPAGQDNSHFSPAHPDHPRIVMGLGRVPDASDPAVIAHEYGHALHYFLLGSHGVTPWEEGFNDFFAACRRDRFNPQDHVRTEVFPWNNSPPVRWDDWRRVDVTERFDDVDYADYDYYLRGSIWASTLWDAYLALGGDAPEPTDREAAADAMIATYLTALPHTGPGQSVEYVARALLRSNTGRAEADVNVALRQAFANRGLTSI